MFYGKLKDQVPLARPVGIVKIRCRCGNKYEFNASRFMSEGFRCKCGFQIEGRGDVVKKAGQRIMRRYEHRPARKH